MVYGLGSPGSPLFIFLTSSHLLVCGWVVDSRENSWEDNKKNECKISVNELLMDGVDSDG